MFAASATVRRLTRLNVLHAVYLLSFDMFPHKVQLLGFLLFDVIDTFGLLAFLEDIIELLVVLHDQSVFVDGLAVR